MSNITCIVDGCENNKSPKAGRGMCQSHYNRWHRSGSPYPKPTPTVSERISAKLIERADGCMEWTGKKTGQGYGVMSVTGKQQYVHRLVLELAAGTLPQGTVVDHICRNRGCARVDHLQAVTQKQNAENQRPEGQGSSGHRGVSWCAQTQSWKVRLTDNGKDIWGGRHKVLESAAEAATKLRAEHFTNSDLRI